MATVTYSTDARYTFDIAYTDIIGNATADYQEEAFVVDHAAPTEPVITYSDHINTWDKILNAVTFGYYSYKDEVQVTLTADDITSGVDYFTWTYTQEAGTSSTNKDALGETITAADITYTNGGKTATATFTIDAQARGYISATVTDRAGNSTDEKIDSAKIVVVDQVAPTISVEYTADDQQNTKVQFVDADGYTVADYDQAATAYYNGNVTAKITVTESNFFEGVQAQDGVIYQIGMKLTVTDNEGNTTVYEYLPAGAVQKYDGATAVEMEWNTQGDVHTFEIPYTADADYVLQIEYTDLSANAAIPYTSKTVAVDKLDPVVSVAYGNTDTANTEGVRNRNETAKIDYFYEDRTATVTIVEHNFRADDVVLTVTATDFEGKKIAIPDYAAYAKVRENWTSNGNTHVLKIEGMDFNIDANYTFDIAYVDLAQNVYDAYETYAFTVDKTVPTYGDMGIYFSASVNQDKQKDDPLYYKDKAVVTIVAKDLTAGVKYFTYRYKLNDDVSAVNAGMEEAAAVDATYENGVAKAYFTVPLEAIDLDAQHQFHGTIEFTAHDWSENATTMKDGTVVIVDDLAPVGKITYNAPVQTKNNISYYDGNINATITIDEANFDHKDVKVTVTRDGSNYPVTVKWTDDDKKPNDIHIGTFTLSKEGDYTVAVSYTDKSTNKMQDYTSNKMTLDTTNPTIKVSNIKANSANKDEKYGFTITVNDTNLNAATLKPVLKAVVEKEDGVYVTKQIDLGKAKTVVAGKTYTYTVDNLPEDGLYTLTCSVKDMADNATTHVVLNDGKVYNKVNFSINRNGSAFGYGNKYTEDMVKQYYIYSVDEDVVLVEVNVDPIENYKVSLNGKELTEGTDYTTSQTSKDGEWSKRTYSIKKALFETEGEYSVIVSSTDKAETTAFSDVKNLTLAFVVDQTKPVLTISGLEASGRYQTNAQTVTLIPTDEGGRLNELSVVVLDSSGNPLKDKTTGEDISVRFQLSGEDLLKYLEENDGMVTFTIPEGLNNQVKIVCTDCATGADEQTNTYDELFQRVTVSQNKIIIFYANTPLFIGTIAGVLALIVLIIFLIKRKKDKKNKA